MLLAVHYRVMEHVGSLESTKEAQELPEAIAEGNSSLLSRYSVKTIFCSLRSEYNDNVVCMPPFNHTIGSY